MSEQFKSIETTELVKIANAIRTKTGTTDKISLEDMPAKIAAIEGGTALPELENEGTASDLLSGKQLIDSEGNIVEGTIATKAATTYTPTTSNQNIAAGTYCSGVQTIKGDANLKAENIAQGVSIFGVTGTHSGGGSGGGGGGAQPDWSAAEGEPGHILNRTHYWKTVEGETIRLNGLVAADEGIYLYLGDPVIFIPGREYSIRYANRTYNCIGIDPAVTGDPIDGGCILGNAGALTGGEDTGEPFAICSFGRKNEDMLGASIVIMDMSGSALHHVNISGPRREREKIALDWLPIPGVASVKFDVTSKETGGFIVAYNSSYEQLAWQISNGFVVFATATLNGTMTLGMTFKDMDEVGILFACNTENPSDKHAHVYEITIPADGSSASFNYYII